MNRIAIPFCNTIIPGVIKYGDENTMRHCIASCLIIVARRGGATPIVASLNKIFV